MQTKLIDSLQLDAYARQLRTVRCQRPGLSGVDDNVVQSDVCSMHATCMQDVDAGQSSVDARTPSVNV